MRLLESESEEEEISADEDLDLPLSIGIAMIFICILSCAAYFHSVNKEQYFGRSIYYAFLFLLLGNYDTKRFNLAIPTYVVLFLCFAAISTTISIIIHNINALMKRVRKKIKKEVEERLAAQAAGGEEGEKKTAEEIIAEIMAKEAPAWMRSIVPQSKMEALVETLEKEEARIEHEVAVQASVAEFEKQGPDARFHTVGVQWPPVCEDKAVGIHIITRNEETQCDELPPQRTIVPTESVSIQATPSLATTGIQFKPSLSDISTDSTDLIELSELGLQIAPLTVEALVQHSTPCSDRAVNSNILELLDISVQNTPELETKSVDPMVIPTKDQVIQTRPDVCHNFAETNRVYFQSTQVQATVPTKTIQVGGDAPLNCANKEIQAEPITRTVKCQFPRHAELTVVPPGKVPWK